LDVAVDQLEFNQALDVRDRLEIDWPTIPVTDLLLSKFQIAQPSPTDLIDIAALVERFDVRQSDECSVSLDRITRICGKSWRWYVATRSACEKLYSDLGSIVILTAQQEKEISAKARSISAAIDEVPKSLGWKVGSFIGARGSLVTPVEAID
jgi:hypothetical protein